MLRLQETVRGYLGRAVASELTHTAAAKLNDAELSQNLGEAVRQVQEPAVGIEFITVHCELYSHAPVAGEMD